MLDTPGTSIGDWKLQQILTILARDFAKCCAS